MKIYSAILCFTGLCAIVRGDVFEKKVKNCRKRAGAEAGRRFAYDLYTKAVSEAGSDDNVFLAPTTVAKALTMVMVGARGRTKSQIWSGLKFPQSSPKVREGDLPCIFGESVALGDGDSKTQKDGHKTMELHEASQVYVEKSYDLDTSYVRNELGAPMLPVDFFNDPTTTREKINDFVAQVTNDKIPDLFSEEDITSNTILAIVSAIYFKGIWKTEFDPETTTQQHFRISDGKATMADFMKTTTAIKFKYSEELDATLLELPYKSSSDGKYDVSMVIIQPEVSMDSLKNKITEEHLSVAIQNLFQTYEMPLKLSMPKFAMSRSYDLTSLLKSMGMTDMFDEFHANLTGMIRHKSPDNANLYVSSAVHKTFIEVNEKGTEAAGATGVVILARTRVPSVELDRPFVFLIYEKKTDKVLFIGRVSDPTAE